MQVLLSRIQYTINPNRNLVAFAGNSLMLSHDANDSGFMPEATT